MSNFISGKDVCSANDHPLWWVVAALSIVAFVAVLVCAGAGVLSPMAFGIITGLFLLAFGVICYIEWKGDGNV